MNFQFEYEFGAKEVKSPKKSLMDDWALLREENDFIGIQIIFLKERWEKRDVAG